MKPKLDKAFTGMIVCLAIHASPVQAGSQQYLQTCEITPDCAPAYQCVKGYCGFPSYVSEEVDACKNKLVAAGVGTNERVASHSRFCYHDTSCPDMYAAIARIAKAEEGDQAVFVSSEPPSTTTQVYGNDQAALMAALRRSKEAATNRSVSPEQAAAVTAAIEAAKKACSQCTAGGKPRCYGD